MPRSNSAMAEGHLTRRRFGAMARQGEVLQKWRNIGQFRRYWCGSQTVGGAPDENCFTMSQTGGVGVKSGPCLKSKRRFRVKCVRTRSDHEKRSEEHTSELQS